MKKTRKNCRKQLEKKGEGRGMPEPKAVKSKTTFQSKWDYVPSDIPSSFVYQALTVYWELCL